MNPALASAGPRGSSDSPDGVGSSPEPRAGPGEPEYVGKVFCRSSQSMVELPDETVDLTVTSPPYWNAIDYERHSSDPEQYYRTRSYSLEYETYEDYLTWLASIGREILRVTKPGGFCAMVLGTVLLRGKYHPVPFDAVPRMVGAGWDFHQDIVWHKVTGGVKRAGVFLQNPYPGYFYPNMMHEYILIFRKPGPAIFRGRTCQEKEKAAVFVGRLFTNEIANSVWHIAPVPPGCVDHPCPFPEEIPFRLIQLYSYPGDLVLDPFCGSGQTLKVAHYLGRRYIGYDIDPKYVALARARIQEPPGIRELQLVPAFDRIPGDERLVAPSGRKPRTRYGKKPAGKARM